MALVEAACAQAGVGTAELTVVLQVGDAEPQRDEAEAATVPGPAKYRKLGDFAEVVTGEVVVPAPVWFVAGNHEPFGALDADGGLAAGAGQWGPDVTYLGRAGVAQVAGLKVGFLSGIYREKSFEAPPGRPRPGKTAGHYTAGELATARTQMATGVDVLVTHDWPTGMPDTGRGGVGDERVRALVDDFAPLLSLHGHMHVPGSAVLGQTQVAGLAIVGRRSGDPMAAVGLWDVDLVRRTVHRLV